MHGQISLDDIPHVEETQRELTQLIEGAPVDDDGDEDEPVHRTQRAER
jgi:hypothetical protein